MWVEKTSHWNLNMSCFLMDMRVTAFFYYPVFTLLTFSLSLTSQSSNIPIFVSHIPSCRLTLPFFFLFFSSVWRKDGISCKESVYLVCVCVSWVQGEKRSRVQSSVIMECFNSLCCLYATSLSLSLSLFSPPPLSLPSQTCSRWNVRLSHRPARCLSSQPSILFSLSLLGLCVVLKF